MSRLTDIADAVAGAINTATLPLPIPGGARRRWMAERSLESLAELHVDVVPRSIERQPLSRGASAQDCTVLVVVQRRVATVDGEVDEDAVDQLLSQAEAIAEALDRRPLEGASFVSSAHEPVVDRDTLADHQLFRSVVALTWRAT